MSVDQSDTVKKAGQLDDLGYMEIQREEVGREREEKKKEGKR